jgi:uncharacterized repeat protein (TIGR01451 family)
MRAWGNFRRPSSRRSGVVTATVLVAVVVGSVLALGAAAARLSGQHRSGDAATARHAMSSTHQLWRANRHVSRASSRFRPGRHLRFRSGILPALGPSPNAALLASTGCGLPSGSIADQTGFEDNDGNLAADSGGNNCTDWNSFATVTWNDTAPYQNATATHGAFTFFGASDAFDSLTDTQYGSGVKQADECPATDTGPVDNKTDLARIYVAATLGSNGHTYLYLAWVRAPQNNTSSDVHVGFEFNQGSVNCANNDGLVQRTTGDILLVYNFTNGGTPTIAMAQWTGTAWSAETTLDPTKAEAAIWNGSGATTDAIKPSNGLNPATQEFGEAGIDLTAAASGLGDNGKPCEHFGKVVGESRTSGSSTSAQMKDIVGPSNINLSNCATPTVVTTLQDAGTNNTIDNGSSIDLGSSVYDTATFTGLISGKTPTGSISYTFFTNGTCNGTGTPAGGGALVGGVAPHSTTKGPLTPGSYSFNASYSSGSDPNYSDSGPSACEPFTVKQGTSDTATVVYDANTNAPWAGTEKTGASAYDTAIVTPSDGITATGTVDYTFFTNGTCQGTGSAAGHVTLDGAGSVPHSSTETTLAAGSYSFQATYNGDSNYAGSTGDCEPFTVLKGTSQTATTVFDASTKAAWAGTEKTGASAYDTATVTPSDGITATGTVDYTFFTNGTCNGQGSAAGHVTLDGAGNVPNSETEGPLAAGSYSFQATYSGDSNYAGSTGDCEPFTVLKGSSQTATTVFDASTKAAWAGTEKTGASAYDTAIVTPSDGITATGTVDYTFFTNDTCDGQGTSAGHVTLDGAGNVPNSATEGPLAAGSYSFQATYSGDSNYAGSTGDCEPFTVLKGSSQTATVVFDAKTNAAWDNTEQTGASAYDTATVTPSDGITATGTVDYTFFTNGSCEGEGSAAGHVTLDGAGNVPNSNTEGPLPQGSYSFQATYSGDSNYAGSTGDCEPFSVGTLPTSTSTTVFDAATKAPWDNTETTGASAYDTATVSGEMGGIVPTGTVDYTFFTNGTCDGQGTSAGQVTLDGAGKVPNSDTETTLAAGSYSFQATYSGDSNYTTSTGDCEPFTVLKGTSQTATTVFDAKTNAVWDNTETTGASAYDTATVTPSDGITATGTVDYTFFTNGTCDGQGSPAGHVTLDGAGKVPNSDPTGPLAAGSYSFQATYNGDPNYAASTGDCEPFTVNQGSSQTATTVFDAGTKAPWDNSEVAGASAYDTATVSSSDGFAATGTVDYTFFSNGTCDGEGSPAGHVTLDGQGNVPNSNTEGPLAAGSYSFQATYNGDSNYAGSTGDCEPFTVGPRSPGVSTVATPSSGSVGEAALQNASDTATFTDGYQLTGQSVSFTLYSDPSCNAADATTVAGSATIDAGGQATFSGDASGLPAGTYYWGVSYAGDQSNNPVSECGGAEGVENETLVIMAPGVHIVKTADAPQVDAGDPIGFTLTVYNDGAGNALGVKLSDTLPTKAGLSWTIKSQGSGWGGSCAITAGVLNCGPATVPAGTTQAASTFTVHITSPTTAATGGTCPEGSGVINNTGSVTTSNDGTDQSTASTCVAAPAVSITKTADHSAPVNAGDPIGFTVEIKNTGTGAANGVTLSDPLPAGSGSGVTWAIDTSVGTPTRFVLAGAQGSQTLSLASSTLPAGADYKVHITAKTSQTECGTYDNTATLTTGNGGNPDPASASESCAFRVDLAITKSGSPVTQELGQGNITWTMVVTNNGPDTDTGVKVSDPMPAGNTYVSSSTTQGTCTGGAILTCDIGTMAAGATVTITLVTTPSAVGIQTNTATVSGDRPETNLANNVANASVEVAPFQPLACVLISSIRPGQLIVGRKTTLTIHLSRKGESVKGIRVRIKGAGINVKTKGANSKGVIKHTLKMKRKGILRFTPLASPSCGAVRIGVRAPFTPPVTG